MKKTLAILLFFGAAASFTFYTTQLKQLERGVVGFEQALKQSQSDTCPDFNYPHYV